MMNNIAGHNQISSEQNRSAHTSEQSEPHLCLGRVYRNVGNTPLLDMLALQCCGTVLDVGCGAGDNARILARHGWSVFGITLSPAEQAAAAPVCSKVWVHDLERGLPDEVAGPYDLVLLSHVLEHLRNPDTLLCQIHRILRSGGQIAVALPNILNWHQRLLFLVGRFEYKEEGIMDVTHLRFYTFSSAGVCLKLADSKWFEQKQLEASSHGGFYGELSHLSLRQWTAFSAGLVPDCSGDNSVTWPK